MQLNCEFATVRAAPRPGLARRAVAFRKASPAVRFASRRDACNEPEPGGGRLVDEGMVVLRRRIQEMEAAEASYAPPAGRAKWEKEWYATYDADVCELVGALQALLVSARPSVGVGLLALLAVSVPTSVFFVVWHLVDACRELLHTLR